MRVSSLLNPERNEEESWEALKQDEDDEDGEDAAQKIPLFCLGMKHLCL